LRSARAKKEAEIGQNEPALRTDHAPIAATVLKA
tara:strand:- start:258 stop:359 length:102 start_codon:yes stop_codon:yes gene_type:complete